jgi:3-oxoacyl-[acyl-carrier-protein] synthase III
MAKPIAARISGIAGYLPPRILSNADLEKMVDTTDEWIRQRVGITERHLVDKGVAASDLAVAAAQEVLKQTSTRADEIDLIVTATVTPDMMFPATSCLIQTKLGASRAWGFDLSAACSGFLYALTVGAQFAGAGTHRKVLVIGSDVMSSIIDYKDRNTCVLFGDGAGAALVEPAEADGPSILDFHHDIDGSGGEFLFMPGGGSLHPSTHETINANMHVVHQAGSNVFKYAVRRMSEVACQLLQQNGFSPSDLALIVPHQANLRIIQAMQERLGLDNSKVMINIERYGNTTAGTIPLGLRDAVAQGRLHKGDLVMLLSVGAGFTTGGMLLRWAY